MSQSEELPEEAERDGPRFRRVEQRRRVALAKYYGLGSDGEWEISEIADYLRVDEGTVENYIYNSEMGQQARDMFPAAEAQMKMDILLEKKKRLDELRDMWEEKLEEKEIAVSRYSIETTDAEMTLGNIDGVRPPSEDKTTIRLDAPRPTEFTERSKLDAEAQSILEEIQKHENDIREMMSLDEPDEVHTTHEGDAVIEQKVYNFKGGVDDDMPDAEVVDVEAQEVDTSQVDPEDDE